MLVLVGVLYWGYCGHGLLANRRYTAGSLMLTLYHTLCSVKGYEQVLPPTLPYLQALQSCYVCSVCLQPSLPMSRVTDMPSRLLLTQLSGQEQCQPDIASGFLQHPLQAYA